MRFRKRVTICKGVSVNLSKKGLSMTAGAKGASVNIGKKGTFLNTGIPGTGIYDRQQIGKPRSKSEKSYYSTTKTTPTATTTKSSFTLEYKEDGKVVIRNSDGNIVEDASLIRSIKGTPQYKDGIERLSQERLAMYEKAIGEMIDIQKQSTTIDTVSENKKNIDLLKPNTYIRRHYTIPEPKIEGIIKELEKEAEDKVSSMKFWKLNAMRTAYVEERKGPTFKEAHDKWINEKNRFEEKENKLEIAENKKYEDDYAKRKEILTALISNNQEIIEKSITEWLEAVEFPFEFNIQFEVKNDVIYIDLDLPEIEDMMDEKAQRMANGIVKVKNKTQKEIKQDYSKCVFGLAIYFASHIFSIATGATMIVISGYTQRRNKKGDIQDDYIYSIKFNRDEFTKLNYKDNERDNCFKFENRCLQKADGGFSTIEPYEQ